MKNHPPMYYSMTKEKDANRCSDEFPIMLNCAGKVVIDYYKKVCGLRHDFYMMILLKGSLKTLSEGKEKLFAAGECVVFPPEKQFYYENNQGNALEYFALHFTGSEAQNLLDRLGIETNKFYFIDLKRELHELFSRLCKEILCLDDKNQLVTSSIIIEILALLSRSIDRHGQIAHLYDSVNYIHQHLSSSITVEKLAEIESLSETRYREIFKKNMDTSPVKYVNDLRITHACTLLSTTDMSISDIASEVGYSDQFYFSRIFKRLRGVSPSKYRK